MPKLTKTAIETGEVVSIRLDRETALYYRRRANEKGISLSEFLRNSIVQGMVAECVLDVEQRMKSVLVEMNEISQSTQQPAIPESLILSIYTCENLLSKIVGGTNIQELYEAQDKAKERLKKEGICRAAA